MSYENNTATIAFISIVSLWFQLKNDLAQLAKLTEISQLRGDFEQGLAR